jgi:predicted dehydrogenase
MPLKERHMPLKMAIVGTGHMGKIHLGKLHAFEGVQVTGIVDIDTAALSALSEKYHVPYFADYKDVADGLNGVVIATPTDTHYSIAKSFMERGVHVFIEKPVTITAGQAKRLVSLAARKGLAFQVGHLERFNPAFRKARQLIQTPLVIEACRTSPFTGRSTDVDVVLDVMIHDLDLILSLIREDVKEIRTNGVAVVTDKIDAAHARIEFANGAVANIFASRVATKRERTLTVFEKGRSFCIDFMQGKLTATTKKHNGEMHIEEFTSDHMDPVQDELTEFIRAMKGNARQGATGEDGLRALILANKIRQHIAKKQR